jgi:hypothetical protein
MKAFRSYITELFDEPFTFVKEAGVSSKRYSYTGAKGGILEVLFNRYPSEETIIVSFDVDGDTGIRAEGDGARVFASVMDAFKRFMEKKSDRPKYFKFSASKQDFDRTLQQDRATSRSRVYTAMIKRFAPRYGYKLIANEEDYFENMFVLERIKPKRGAA